MAERFSRSRNLFRR